MAGRYNLPDIRTLLIRGFTDEELRRLCHDTPQFRPVYHELARNTGKATIVDRLLEYAQAKLLLDDLLALAQQLNPAQFEQHRPYYDLISDLPPSSTLKSEPQINNPKNLSLPSDAELILKKMFAGYWRVVILQEFGSGFSGSRIFLVQPQRDPQSAELRAVVKLASRSLIEKEWRAFRRYIRDQMPHITEVRGEPVLAENGWGGLRYLLLGGGVFEIESMASFCRRAGPDETRFALSRLLKIIEQISRFSQADPAFHLQASYDSVLPVNLLLEPASPPPEATLHPISPDHLPVQPLRPGDYVRLSGFIITKVDLTHHSVTLNRPPALDGFPASYCLRLQNLAGAMDHYTVDQVIEPLTGRVVQTRAAWLQAEAQRAVGPEFDLSGNTLTGPAGQRWPNPLTRWPDIVNEIRQVKVAYIHGDLNLENIIVDPVTRDVSLIDFAEARRDHLLHDLLRLETEIVTKLIPEILHQYRLPAETMLAFYDNLHRATRSSDVTATPQPPHPALEKPLALLVVLRKQARQCLFKPDDWSEYDQGLVLYLLGALKFANLDEMPKAVAFWGAVGVVGMMEVNYLASASRDILIENNRIITDYNTSVVRELIFITFNDETLTTFCYDHFGEVRHKFRHGMTFQEKVQLLVEYCERNRLFDQLLILIREINPAQFDKFTSSSQLTRLPKETEQPENWVDYIDKILVKQNYIMLDDLERISEPARREVIDYYKIKSTYDLIYNDDKTCLMFRYWPRLRDLNNAWENLSNHLDSHINTFTAQWAKFAQTLEDTLGVGSRSTQSATKYNRIVGYKINAGSAFEGLNLPRELLFCAAQYPKLELSEMDSVYHLVKNQYHVSIALLLSFSDETHTEQIQLSLDKGYKHSQACDIIVLTFAEVSSWLKSDHPLDELRRTILKRISLKAVSPFVVSGPTPETMFFGRENELRQIRDHLAHQSFAIIGGRRIGKTSLAQRLLKEYLPAANFYALYQDISFISNSEQFLSIKLTNWQPALPTSTPVTMGDLLAAHSLDRPVALLLDEADKLVPVDRKLGWPVFNQLRAAANGGQLRVILIGERQLREGMQDARSPLFNFVNDIVIGRLNFENVEKLITQPLEKLEIIYDPAIVRRIYEFTSGHPNIVQRLCYQLIERLDIRNDRKLSLSDVEAVVNDPGFQRDDFLNTYLSQATLLEHILTILLARAERSFYNLADIRQLLGQDFGLKPLAREINAALRRLVDLRSILAYTAQGYTFAVGAIPLVINQSRAIATTDLLEQYVEDYRTHGDKTPEEIEALEWA